MMRKYKRIYFRADADRTIGYGHFIRSLALADMLKDNFECIFCTQLPSDYQKKEMSKVCSYVELPADESKFSVFLNLLKGDEIVVLDNYFFTTEYQRAIKSKGCKLVCLGTNDKPYVADLIISQYPLDVNSFIAKPYTRFCIGLEWALLRKSFLVQTNKRKVWNVPRRIVVCFGGTDFYNLTGKVVRLLNQIPFVEEVNVIVGDAYQGDIDINSGMKVTLHKNLSADDIIAVFDENDIAVLSASSVCVEAMACGIPVLAGYYVENQRGFYDIITQANYVIGLGNLLEKEWQERLVKAMENKIFFHLSSPFRNLSDIKIRYNQVFMELCG